MADVWQGTLALMVLKTLETMGPLHGYGIARRIEQTSGDRLAVNYGTLYPALLKLEQEGYIAVGVGRVREQPQGEVLPAHARRARSSSKKEAREWERTTAIIARFLVPPGSQRHETAARLAACALGGVFSRDRRERELADELESHLADAHRRQHPRRHDAGRGAPAGA